MQVEAKSPKNPFQEKSDQTLPSQPASLAEKIQFPIPSSEPNIGNRIIDHKITSEKDNKTTQELTNDQKKADEEPGLITSILNHPVTKTVGAIAITILVSWITSKLFDTMTGTPVSSNPSLNRESKNKDKMESLGNLKYLSMRIPDDTEYKSSNRDNSNPRPKKENGGGTSNPTPKRDNGDGASNPRPKKD